MRTKKMNRLSKFKLARLAVCGAIVGVSFANIFFGGHPSAEIIGATSGGLTTALILKVLHIV
jgi:hypothetical protein